MELLLVHLAPETEHRSATLLIHPVNLNSLGPARRLGFEPKGEVEGEAFFVRQLTSLGER